MLGKFRLVALWKKFLEKVMIRLNIFRYSTVERD